MALEIFAVRRRRRKLNWWENELTAGDLVEAQWIVLIGIEACQAPASHERNARSLRSKVLLRSERES